MSTTGDNLGTAIANAMFAPASPATAQLTAWKKFGNALVDNWVTGSAILYGTDVPAAVLGNNGDFYIRRTTGIVEWYGPKTAGSWGTGISLIGPAGADGADGQDGASFNPMGEWDDETSYVVFDFVTHEGSSYFSKTNHIGVEPPNATHWQLVAEKGDVGDIAAHNGLSGLQGGATGERYHMTAAELAKLQAFPNKITVSATEPTSPTTGDLWVDIS